MENSFNNFGFFKEYYIGNKFIGSLPCEKDREDVGYIGRKEEKLKDTVVFRNKKKIKSGESVTTIIYPLCGRMKK